MVTRIVVLFFTLLSFAHAWSDHARLTRAALQPYDDWEKVKFVPIEKVLSSLTVGLKPSPKTRRELAELLNVQPHKLEWDRPLVGASANALDLLVESVNEPDNGMDQDLNLAPYQDQMGGYTGLSSQAPRHMYYGSWRWNSPVATFHMPFQEMGFAPDRAELFFSLARQAKAAGYPYWGWRFLGWGLHYVQDLTQPYHSSQIGSLQLIGLSGIFSGWKNVVKETTRRVGNFHLSYEEFVEFLLKNPQYEAEAKINSAILVAESAMSSILKLDTPIRKTVVEVSELSADLAPEIVKVQSQLIGPDLFNPSMDLISGFTDAKGVAKIDFRKPASDLSLAVPRAAFYQSMRKGLSNMAAATRWYVERYKNVN